MFLEVQKDTEFKYALSLATKWPLITQNGGI